MGPNKKSALILGGHGFIGHHLARRLKSEGYWVRTVDIKQYEYGDYDFTDDAVILDLRDIDNVNRVVVDKYQEPYHTTIHFDEVYALCCLMGGANFIFTKENDADIMHDSALMNLNVAKALSDINFKGKLFYSSSACIYPSHIQEDINNPGLKESQAFPANPDSCYGYEKIFSEIMYDAYRRNKGLDIRIARFHNVYGPEGTYTEPKAKAPAAICRKVSESENDIIEVWGDGKQTRSFLYIDDCIDAVRLLMDSDFKEPINIGSEEMISINDLAEMVIAISGKHIDIKNIPGPTGVRGRNSDNTLIRSVLNWKPKYSLREGMEKTFNWINGKVNG